MKKFFSTILFIFSLCSAWSQNWEKILPGDVHSYTSLCSAPGEGSAILLKDEYSTEYFNSQVIWRFSPSGDTMWTLPFEQYSGDTGAQVQHMIMQPNGNLLVLAKWIDTVTGPWGYGKIYEINTAGNITYSQIVTDALNTAEIWLNASTDSNYYISYLIDTAGLYYEPYCSCLMPSDTLLLSIRLAKYNSDHVELWSENFFNGPFIATVDVDTGIFFSLHWPSAIDQDGGLFLLKSTGPSVSLTTYSIQKLNSDGTFGWIFSLRDTLNTPDSLGVGISTLVPTRDSGCIVQFVITYGDSTTRTHLIRLNKSGSITDSLSYLTDITISRLPAFENSAGNIVCFQYYNATGSPSSPTLSNILVLDAHLNFLSFYPEPFFSSVYIMDPGVIPNTIGGGILAGSFSGGFISPAFNTTFICSFDSLMNTYPGHMNGSVIRDNDHNCTETSGDIPFSGSVVSFTNTVTSDEHFTFSSSLGDYSAHIPYGNYNINHSLKPYNVQECPASSVIDDVTLPAPTLYTHSFYDTLIPGIHDLRIFEYVNYFLPGYYSHTHHHIYVHNDGTVTADAVLKVVKDPTLDFVSATPAADSVVGDSIYFSVSALGYDSYASFDLLYGTPASVPIGTPLVISTSVEFASDLTPGNNYDTLYKTVMGSYDPNEKEVNRPLYTAADHDFVYRVQFQNTGTYYAKNVLVVDTIDNDLDMSTFKVLSGSPSMPVVSWHEGNRLFFNFPDIYLPDSNTNEPGSHGEFVYSIRPKWSIAVGDTITNTAYIYFDYNAPVITNTTMNIISSNPMSSGAVMNNAAEVRLYPNPSTGQVNLILPAGNEEKWTLIVTDLTGHEVLRRMVNDNSTFDLNESSGLYLVQLRNMRTGENAVRKIVLER